MNRPFTGLLVACMAIVMIVGGCGGSDDSSDSTAGTDSTAGAELTKAQFLKQGNAVCADTNEEIQEGFQEFLKENSISENERLTTAELSEVAEDIVAPIVGRQIKELRELGAPAGEEGQVEKILAAAEEGIQKSEEDPSSLLAGEGESAFGKANRLAQEYGLKTCSE